MANYSVTAIIIFIVITILYFISYVLTPNKKVSKVLTIIYYFLIFGSQISIVLLATKQQCGEYQLGTALQYGIIPWIVIFGGLVALLHVFPGWKAPFSNTFGYFVTYLMGIKTVFNKILKSDFKSSNIKLNKIMQDVYQDKAMLINEITPNNFEKAITELSPIMNSSVVTNNKINWGNDALKTLKKLVIVKDEVSRFIWYVLIGTLITSMSNLGIMAQPCNHSVKQMEANVANHQTKTAAAAETSKNKIPQTYNIRD